MSDHTSENRKKLPVLTAEGGTGDKTVLPEVLPDPRRPNTSASSPRSRTLAHMQRMLATATAVAVAGTGSISCGKEVKNGGSEKQGCGSKIKGSTSSSSGESSSSGYAVVDPMPTPAFCPGISKIITPSARLSEEGGVLRLTLTLSKPTARDDWKYVSDAPVTIMNGTMEKTVVLPDGTITVVAKVDPSLVDSGSVSMNIAVKGTCNQGPTTISASVSWSGKAKTATPLVYLNEF